MPKLEVTYWPTIEDAREALAELAADRCGPHCIGVHSAIHIELNRDPLPRAKRDRVYRLPLDDSAPRPPRRRLPSSTEGITSGHAHAV